MSGGTTGGPADPTRPPSGALALPDLPSGLAHAHARRVTDDDAEGVIALIGAAYAEHPGCVLDLPGVDADLVAPATHAHARAADWWVVVDPSLPDPIVASVAHGPVTLEGDLELKRLYVAATHRRQGLAGALTGFVLARARAAGARAVVAWSDTRFHDAHRLYEGLGFVRGALTRDLDDPSCTCEAHFRIDLTRTD